MKKITAFGLASLSLLLAEYFQPSETHADSNQFCGNVASTTQPPYIPTTGTFRTLIVFVQFQDDNFNTPPSCIGEASNGWPTSPPALPNWASGTKLIHSQATPPYTSGSLSDFYYVMSNGSFNFIGDIYPQLYLTPQPKSYYDDTQGRGRGWLNQQIIEWMDPNVNFNNYDNDNDGDVDMILFIYRNWNKDIFGAPFQGRADLGFSGSIVRDGKTIYGGFDPGSGISQNDVYTLANCRDIVTHEISHYQFGGNHFDYLGEFGVHDGRDGASAMSGYERLILGWINPTIISSNTFITLTDAPTTSSYYRINIPNSDEYFLLENRQALSIYDQSDNCQTQAIQATGLMIAHIQPSAIFKEDRIRWEAADDSFLINGDPGQPTDSYKPGNKIQFTPWTRPNSDRSNGNFTGIAATNINQSGNNITADIVLNFSSGTITENSWWEGAETITGNVTVAAGATLTISSGAIVTLNPGVTVTVEGSLVIAANVTITGGGTIVTQGGGKIFPTNSAAALASNNSRKFTLDVNGNYHLVFETEGEICYEKLTNSGTAISEFRLLSNGTGGGKTNPCIYVRDGNILVVWQKNTGSSHDITFHKSTDYGATWPTSNRKVTAGSVGSSPPLPVIVSQTANQLLVVYKTATNLSYQTSSDNGNTWSAVTAVPSSGSSGNSPTLALTTSNAGHPRTGLVNATSGGVGTIFYRYYRNGDSTGWSSLLKNLSTIVPGSYTGHQNPSLAPSGTSSNQTLHVAWEATQTSSGYRLIIHRKATNWSTWPSVYSTTYYQEQQLPSIVGLTNNTAELLFQYVSQTGVYKMHYDGSSWGGPVSVGDAYGTTPSVSVGNTSAKYVWTSGGAAPFQIKTSTETLSKSTASPLATIYHRSIAVIDTMTGNWLEVRLDKLAVKTKSGEEMIIPFAAAKEDDKTLTPANAFVNLASSSITLPAEAESLFVHCQVNGQGLSSVKKRENAINVEITFAPKNAAAFKLPVINTAAEALPETKRTIALAASNFAGKEISLIAQVSGIDTKSSLIASLGHIYEVVETPIGKTLETIAENAAPQDYVLSAYPNPFWSGATSRFAGNPSTQIHFTMKEAGRAAVSVYNLNGQLVRELLNESRVAGEHTVPWDGRDHRGGAAASGVYFIRLEAGAEVKQSKVMLVR